VKVSGSHHFIGKPCLLEHPRYLDKVQKIGRPVFALRRLSKLVFEAVGTFSKAHGIHYKVIVHKQLSFAVDEIDLILDLIPSNQG
jgi:hypothetical protein